MSEPKFTKGEWVVYDKSMDWGNVGFDELVIGMDSFNQDWRDHYCSHKIIINDTEEEARANAHLIASAPAMYKALEALSTGEGLQPGTTIESILLKARGE